MNFKIAFRLFTCLFLLAKLFVQCSNKHDIYHGYVYDKETKMPIEYVFVKEKICKNPLSEYTNEQGFFYNKEQQWIYWCACFLKNRIQA